MSIKKQLVVVTRDTKEYDKFWGFNTEDCDVLCFVELEYELYSILIIKSKDGYDISNEYQVYIEFITSKIELKNEIEIAVIFHLLNGDGVAGIIKEKIENKINKKLSFCKSYSSTKKDFWSEQNSNTDLPYNNLKNAWKDIGSNKNKTFEAVWDYFLGDSVEESLTNAIFEAIYEQKNEEFIEKAISKRDIYIKNKGKY
jgi:hypothetical protein